MELRELKELYNKVDNQDRKFFIIQLLDFRKKMCSTEFTIEYKEKEFLNLSQAYFRCDLNDGDITLFKSTADEFERRMLYEQLNITKHE